jgi:ABC-2 type transport system permease protein
VRGFLIGFSALYRRELGGYLGTPTAYVFVAAFLAAASLFAFQIGGLFEAGRADLQIFFQFHPWLFLIFMPALAMRAWADEMRTGTLETLLAIPVPTASLVLGKFMAAWSVAGIALVLSFPLWIALSWLGPVDHGATLATYFGSFLMAGAYLAVGTAMSAITSNQVVAFVLGVLVAFIFTAAGLPIVGDTLSGLLGSGLLGQEAGKALTMVSLLDQFEGLNRGVIEARAIVFFTSFIAAWLAVTTLFIDGKRRVAA